MENFKEKYKASVDKVVDCFDNEIRNNSCFRWTSEVQGATEYDLLADVIIENERRGVRWEQASRRTIVGGIEEDALAILRAQNAIDEIKREIDGRVNGLKALSEPHVVKNAFLHSDKQAKIIKEMYGDSFDSISTNRDKYLTFLQRVEADGRISELDDILKRYEK
jgi:hypothetical protein